MPEHNNKEVQDAIHEPDNNVLPFILRKYKALVFSPAQKADINEATIDRLMESTQTIRADVSAQKSRLLYFRLLPWLAAAACFMVILSAAVFFHSGRAKPDLVILNVLSIDSNAYAMRGGEPNILSADSLINTLKSTAVRQLGESRVTISRSNLEPGDLDTLPEHYPAHFLNKVRQRYVILIEEEENAAGEQYRICLFDTRERKAIAIRTLPVGTTPETAAGMVAEMMKSVRR